MTVVVLACKAAAALALILAAAAKSTPSGLLQLERTVLTLLPRTSPLRAASRAIAVVIVVAEGSLGAAGLVLTGFSTDVLVLTMLSVLLGVALWGALRHPGVPCACLGGLAAERFGRATVARGAVLVAAAAIPVLMRPQVLSGMTGMTPLWAALALTAVGVTAFAVAAAGVVVASHARSE